MWLIKKEKIKQRMDVMPQPNNNTNESGNRNQQKKAKRMKEGQKTHSVVSAGPVSANQLNKQTAIQHRAKVRMDGRTLTTITVTHCHRHQAAAISLDCIIYGLTSFVTLSEKIKKKLSKICAAKAFFLQNLAKSLSKIMRLS